MARVESIEALYDFIGYVVLCAPNQFPARDYLPQSDQMNLDRAFAELRGAITLIRPELSDARRMALLDLLERSLGAYRADQVRQGAHLLQDFQDAVFGGGAGHS
jgi:hypothetical protein